MSTCSGTQIHLLAETADERRAEEKVESACNDCVPVVLPVPPALHPQPSLRCQLMKTCYATGRLSDCP
ncbi:hypothetical protein LDENG_00123880 [Lucifuga dentata]|nr:hypothetical protein LDENG_00123880 [Lucifuga dentata]